MLQSQESQMSKRRVYSQLAVTPILEATKMRQRISLVIVVGTVAALAACATGGAVRPEAFPGTRPAPLPASVPAAVANADSAGAAVSEPPATRIAPAVGSAAI